MNNKLLFALSGAGAIVALVSAYVFAQQPSAQAPVFNPAADPYAKGIYAVGIVESFQAQGENINIYPEVSGPITRILVAEGQKVRRGTPLLTIDDSIQRATAEQERLQAQAALATLEELRAQPRPEALAVAAAQVRNATASVKSAKDEFAKQETAYKIDPQAVSKDALDNARNAADVAETNLQVVTRQYALTKAGAWAYDVNNQQQQYNALEKAHEAAAALLEKYTLRAPVDGVVLAVQATVGSYVSPQGAYGTYTEGFGPLVVMGGPERELEVRCSVDEILVHRLPPPSKLKAVMFIQGTDIRIPLTYVRLQPYVSPKIELSNEREERVDVRVLPVIFRFQKPKGLNLFPGQLVDVYIGES